MNWVCALPQIPAMVVAMRFSIPQIPLVVVMATLLLTPVLPAAPEAGALNSTDSAKIVWRIGKEDQDYGDFALAGNNKDYQLKFPQKTLLYEIGKSNPATDWPYIQPGTADAWGTRHIQPRVIRFTLPDEPRGVFVLRIAMVDVHPSDPSALKVAVNGQEGSFSFNPGAEWPRSSTPKPTSRRWSKHGWQLPA